MNNKLTKVEIDRLASELNSIREVLKEFREKEQSITDQLKASGVEHSLIGNEYLIIIEERERVDFDRKSLSVLVAEDVLARCKKIRSYFIVKTTKK